MKSHLIKIFIEHIGVYYGVDFTPIIDASQVLVIKLKTSLRKK